MFPPSFQDYPELIDAGKSLFPVDSNRLHYPNEILLSITRETVDTDDKTQWKFVVYIFISFHVEMILPEWNLQIAYGLRIFFGNGKNFSGG